MTGWTRRGRRAYARGGPSWRWSRSMNHLRGRGTMLPENVPDSTEVLEAVKRAIRDNPGVRRLPTEEVKGPGISPALCLSFTFYQQIAPFQGRARQDSNLRPSDS